MHDFRAPDAQAEQENKHLIRPLTIIAARNRNKVVPIPEVPSSESENSSKRQSPRPNHTSARSHDSYGFQPRESAVMRTTSMNNEALLTGAALVMLTTEADDNRSRDDE